MTHLLVTNDYPPKLGGIQSYLWELWRRLPPDETVVVTASQPNAGGFDAAACHRIIRLAAPVLLPTLGVRAAVRRIAQQVGATLVVLDPALPLGLLGPSIGLPYAVVLHGAEVAIPARLPGLNTLLSRVVRGARLVVSAGGYPAAEARRLLGRAMPETVVVPPGVDLERFRPLSDEQRRAARGRLGLPVDGRVVVAVNRLVPRKGLDVLIEAAGRLASGHPDLTVAIGGTGRDAGRLGALAARRGAPVRFLGRVADGDLPDLLGAADVVAMLCRDRWLGLEQEGFGIVFLEGAAAGVAVLAGRSGGSEEAVAHELTGLVVDRPGDVALATSQLARLLDDGGLRDRFGKAGRTRAEERFDYDQLAARLRDALSSAAG
ncbi:MAG: glycosyltransferase [Acidimicrobiaceae bacterium]|nr:glycosyltransferase [Acidimicrobiaceae bacterium]